MMGGASLKPEELQHLGDTLRMVPVVLPMLGKIVKYGRLSLQDFASRFKHPFLKEAIRFFVDAPGWPMPDFPMIVLSGFIRTGLKEAPAPLGGSQGLANHVADLYKNSGGALHLKSKVTRLLMEKKRVTGIQLEDGTRHYADHVIWAGDGHTLIYDLLNGKYLSEQISHMYENWKPVNPIIHVAMGVDQDFSDEPHCIIFEPSEPITIAGMENKWLTLRHHCFDPSMAPKGKSAVEVWYTTEYGYWEELYKDKKAYQAEKKRIADYTVAQLERRWPGYASRLEVIDVPTPATYHRFTGNWKGSPDGWYCNMENYTKREPVRTLPGLEGLRMVGQWTAPYTGVVLASLTGRQSIQLICKEDGRTFQTEKAISGPK
jgi:phytoene dehydrogenase-like protein